MTANVTSSVSSDVKVIESGLVVVSPAAAARDKLMGSFGVQDITSGDIASALAVSGFGSWVFISLNLTRI